MHDISVPHHMQSWIREGNVVTAIRSYSSCLVYMLIIYMWCSGVVCLLHSDSSLPAQIHPQLQVCVDGQCGRRIGDLCVLLFSGSAVQASVRQPLLRDWPGGPRAPIDFVKSRVLWEMASCLCNESAALRTTLWDHWTNLMCHWSLYDACSWELWGFNVSCYTFVQMQCIATLWNYQDGIETGDRKYARLWLHVQNGFRSEGPFAYCDRQSTTRLAMRAAQM